jgi:hypothetical protein
VFDAVGIDVSSATTYCRASMARIPVLIALFAGPYIEDASRETDVFEMDVTEQLQGVDA